jgi:hypothetical protein
MRQDSSAGIVTRLCTGQSGVQFLAGTRFFGSPKCPDRLRGLSDSYSMGTLGGRLFPQVYSTRGTRSTTHPPSSTNVKNKWSYSSAPPIRLHCVEGETLPLLFILDIHQQNAQITNKVQSAPYHSQNLHVSALYEPSSRVFQ